MTLKLFVCPGCGTKITIEDDQIRVGGHTFHRDCAQSTHTATPHDRNHHDTDTVPPPIITGRRNHQRKCGDCHTIHAGACW